LKPKIGKHLQFSLIIVQILSSILIAAVVSHYRNSSLIQWVHYSNCCCKRNLHFFNNSLELITQITEKKKISVLQLIFSNYKDKLLDFI